MDTRWSERSLSPTRTRGWHADHGRPRPTSSSLTNRRQKGYKSAVSTTMITSFYFITSPLSTHSPPMDPVQSHSFKPNHRNCNVSSTPSFLTFHVISCFGLIKLAHFHQQSIERTSASAGSRLDCCVRLRTYHIFWAR